MSECGDVAFDTLFYVWPIPCSGHIYVSCVVWEGLSCINLDDMEKKPMHFLGLSLLYFMGTELF